jgi:dynactin complex subunit
MFHYHSDDCVGVQMVLMEVFVSESLTSPATRSFFPACIFKKSNNMQTRVLTREAHAVFRWVGVVYDEPVGKNDGSIKGVRYWKCKNNHGHLIRPDKIRFCHAENALRAAARGT